MFQPAVGDYVLVERRGTRQPLWPGILIPQDLIPASSSAPSYHHTVLLIKEVPEVHYAPTRELHQLDDMFPNPDELTDTNGLREAYELLHRALGSDLDPLDYWRMMTQSDKRQEASPSSLDSSSGSDSSEATDDSDQDMREAKRQSLVEKKRTRKTPFPTPSESPPYPAKRSRAHDTPRSGGIRDSTVAGPSKPNRPRIEKADVIEGDITQSGAFVEFLVGPDKKSFIIPKTEIDIRSYFSNLHHGLMRAKGVSGWTIDLPALPTLDPDDFSHAADFLMTGDFGLRIIADENRDQAFAECVSAWEVADALGMEDLLEYIACKMEHVMPWTSSEVLAFVAIVYRTSGAPLDGHERMKGLLTDFMADNWHEMVREFGVGLWRRVWRVPELERDVLGKVAVRAQRRMDAEEAMDWEEEG
ncbi:hypothetical protein CC80DRAFT_591082 [Byssothecium circinans]|uniref:Uncharacterized protein n=1 Tax=Byssothecium circinans TaxID=147558 RepID=A0A6A5UAP7_9PLEO|nr:hypothetical protein CC80DRAFT_591082 [Byssothecium circinans]